MINEKVKCQNLSDSALKAEIDLKAAPDKVFGAWAKPDQFVKWFGPRTGGGTLRVDHFDCTVGGRYDVTMLFNDGDQVRLSGEYREVDPPKKLVFTWQWKGDSPEISNETLVTVDLVPSDLGTLLTLTHERFLTTEARDQHHGGWEPLLVRLASILDS